MCVCVYLFRHSTCQEDPIVFLVRHRRAWEKSCRTGLTDGWEQPWESGTKITPPDPSGNAASASRSANPHHLQARHSSLWMRACMDVCVSACARTCLYLLNPAIYHYLCLIHLLVSISVCRYRIPFSECAYVCMCICIYVCTVSVGTRIYVSMCE